MTGNSLFVVVLAALVCSTLAEYSDCGSTDGTLVSVEVSKCAPTARRCILRRNSNATMIINFQSANASQTLKSVVHGEIMGVPVPFALPNNDGCKDSGLTCPLAPGTTYKFQTTMPILGSYPRVTVDIKWELKDDAGKDIICALIPAKLV